MTAKTGPSQSMVEHQAEVICYQLGIDPFKALPQVQGERMTTHGGLVAHLLRGFWDAAAIDAALSEGK